MNVLITGALSNIAYEVGLKLSFNNKVYLTVHKEEQIKTLKEKNLNANIEVFKLDITNKEDYKKIDDLDIDLFIASASIGIGGSVLDMDMNYFKKNYEVNVFSNFELIKYVFNKMHKKGGKIFIMSSLASMMPLVMLEGYTSTKAAISIIATTLKKELKIINSKVKISLIEPGAYYTGFNQVMIDNKENALNKQGIFYKYRNVFTKRQRRIFNLIERKNKSTIVNKIVKQSNKKNPKFKIRAPITQVIFIKLYLIIFR